VITLEGEGCVITQEGEGCVITLEGEGCVITLEGKGYVIMLEGTSLGPRPKQPQRGLLPVSRAGKEGLGI